MDREALYSGIGLQTVFFQPIEEFYHSSTWKILEPEIDRLICGDTAHEAYLRLCSQLGDDSTGMLACYLEAARRVYDRYQEKGIPDDIFFATMACFSRFLDETYRRTGKWTFDRGFWTWRQVSMRLFRVGMMEYELCPESKTIALHLPTNGNLRPQEIDQTLEQAAAFIRRYYPEYDGCPYTAESWLLSPELKKLLPENSNILAFQRRFQIDEIYPDDRDYMQWLFEAEEDVPVAQLKENTSLQRKAKAYLLAGGKLGAAGGKMI